MHSFMLSAVLLVAASSAFAQTPVLTNADLGKPRSPTITISPEVWRGLIARQFVYVPPARGDEGGARVAVSAWTPPVLPPTYPLQPYFFMRTYLGHGHDGDVGRSLHVPDAGRPRR